MNHTPGPWKVCENGNDVYAPETDTSITNSENFCYPNQSEAEANARLIAAAPELLAALEFALNLYDNITTANFQIGGDKEARERMQAAIQKAKG